MSKGKVEIDPMSAKRDERLEYLLKQVKVAVEMFVKAIRESSEEHECVGFKAFTLASTKQEALMVFDIAMTAVALELKEIADDLITKFTFYHKVEHEEHDIEHSLILMCDKKEPPTKEEIEEMAKKEKESEVTVSEKEEVVLPHASGIEYYKRPGGE